MTHRELQQAIEGILFALGKAVKIDTIATALDVSKEAVAEELAAMQELWDTEERGIRLVKLDDSYQMCTAKELYPILIQIAKQPKKHELSDILLETLSIIAYKQPITKAEIENIRGVSSDHAVNKLVDYQLVQELGRLDAPGRPMLFGTTEQFLRSFGVASLDELPAMSPVRVEEFKMEATEEAEEMDSAVEVEV